MIEGLNLGFCPKQKSVLINKLIRQRVKRTLVGTMESEIQEKGLNQFCTVVYEVLFYGGL